MFYTEFQMSHHYSNMHGSFAKKRTFKVIYVTYFLKFGLSF